MEKIPTAEEFMNLYHGSTNKHALIEFAKMHVTAALKKASENATVTPIDHEEISEGSFRPIWGVDDDSILNSYPLTNIK